MTDSDRPFDYGNETANQFAEELMQGLDNVVSFYRLEEKHCLYYADHPRKSHHYSNAHQNRKYSNFFAGRIRTRLEVWDGKDFEGMIALCRHMLLTTGDQPAQEASKSEFRFLLSRLEEKYVANPAGDDEPES